MGTMCFICDDTGFKKGYYDYGAPCLLCKTKWSNQQNPESWAADCKAITFPFNIEKLIRWILSILPFKQPEKPYKRTLPIKE
jgi:hypothetical protein